MLDKPISPLRQRMIDDMTRAATRRKCRRITFGTSGTLPIAAVSLQRSPRGEGKRSHWPEPQRRRAPSSTPQPHEP
jgi:hypothetical protein